MHSYKEQNMLEKLQTNFVHGTDQSQHLCTFFSPNSVNGCITSGKSAGRRYLKTISRMLLTYAHSFIGRDTPLFPQATQIGET